MTNRRHSAMRRFSRQGKIVGEMGAQDGAVEHLANGLVVPAREEDQRVGREAEGGARPGERVLEFGALGHVGVLCADVLCGALFGGTGLVWVVGGEGNEESSEEGRLRER